MVQQWIIKLTIMNESKEELTEEEIKKKAYLMALRLKNSGLDTEAIYARLEKQSIPEDMALQVAKGVSMEKKRHVAEQETRPVFHAALIRIAVGLAAALISTLIFPDEVVIPVGLIGGGVIAAVVAYIKMKE
jgi:hypothetical protein